MISSIGFAFDGTICDVINESGSVLLNNNIEGAPISASPASGTTCIRINVSDVVLDCNGYTITNNGTSSITSGIFLFNSTNITVKNCPMISRYSYGVNLYFTNNSLVNNITLFNNSQTSILNTYSSNNILTSNNITSSTGGISISTGSINNTINDNNISFGSYGLIISQNNANFFSSNQIFNNSVSGVNVIGSSNNTFTNNEVYNNGNGFLVAQTNIWETINNNFFDNNVYNNSGYGFNLSSSHNNTFTNNVVNKNQYGIILLQSENNSINSNTFCTNAVLDINNNSGTGNSGDLNRCDSVNNWADTSNLSGCTYSCPLPTFDGTGCGFIDVAGSYQLANDLSGATVDAAPLTGTACVKINTSNVIFDCNGYSITGSGSANTFGILVQSYPDPLTNITVRNCPNISLYGDTGVYAWVVENSTFSNITSHNNKVGLYFDSGMNNTGSDNTAYDNSDTGFVINDEADTISGNTAYNNTNNGFDILGSTNLLANNTARSSQACFYIESDYENLTNNTASNCTKGFYVQAGYNLLANNTAYLSGSGFYVELTIYSNYTGNRAYNNTDGFLLNPPSGLIKCISPPCFGFNNFVSNLVYNNTANGFDINVSGDNNNFTNNRVYDNAQSGFLKGNVDNDRLTNNSVYNNAYGIYLNESTTNLFFGNTIFNNTVAGVYDLDADPVQLSGDRFYNNRRDFLLNEIYDSQITLNLSGVIFDNPSGVPYQNYTNLTIVDIIQNESYSINWSTNSTSLPAGLSSFARKFVDISNLSGNVSIDSINWTWLDSELTGYNENIFELWKFNSSGWTVMNNTPNTAANTLSLSSMNPGSIYGILYQSTTACGSIAATVNEKNTSGKGKAVITPLSDATVSAYSLADSCVKSNQRNASAVLSNCPPPSGSCVTLSNGQCPIGPIQPGSYLVIANSTKYAAPQSSSIRLVDCKTKSVTLTFNTALAILSEPIWESSVFAYILAGLVIVAVVGALYYRRSR